MREGTGRRKLREGDGAGDKGGGGGGEGGLGEGGGRETEREREREGGEQPLTPAPPPLLPSRTRIASSRPAQPAAEGGRCR